MTSEDSSKFCARLLELALVGNAKVQNALKILASKGLKIEVKFDGNLGCAPQEALGGPRSALLTLFHTSEAGPE